MTDEERLAHMRAELELQHAELRRELQETAARTGVDVDQLTDMVQLKHERPAVFADLQQRVQRGTARVSDFQRAVSEMKLSGLVEKLRLNKAGLLP